MSYRNVRKLLILATGGTISGKVATTASRAHTTTKPLGMLQSLVPILSDLSRTASDFDDIQVDTLTLTDLDSSDIQPSNWVDIADAVSTNYHTYDGFIVTHGTNTMAYTSAALSFALENISKPVVVTGSQVPFGWPGSDAVFNLENALRVVTWEGAPGPIRGVICVFGSRIITGTRAKKTTEFDYDALQSHRTASLGRIGRVIRWNVESVERHHHYLSKSPPEACADNPLRVTAKFDTRILSFGVFPGMDRKVLEHLLDHLVGGDHLRGVIFQAFGAGDVGTYLHPVFVYLREAKIPVLITTQAADGVSSCDVNAPGRLLRQRALAIPAYDMSLECTTTKLMWLLGQKLGYDEICSRMLEDLHGEISLAER